VIVVISSVLVVATAIALLFWAVVVAMLWEPFRRHREASRRLRRW